MRSIWKFGLNGGNTQIKEKVIKWLSVGYDPSGDICVWAIVDPEAGVDEKVEYDILQIGTGWDFSKNELDSMEFIGTVKEGSYMWHIFVNQPGKFKEKEKTYDEYNEESNYDHVNMTVNFGGMALG